MLRLANLVPAPGSKHIFEPRPSRFWFVDFAQHGFDLPTEITALEVIGNTAYGMITTRRFPGHDEPFVVDLTTGAFATVLGVTQANTPSTILPLIPNGNWTPPTITKVGPRVVVTHLGFPGGTTTAAQSGVFVGNTRAGFATVTGALGNMEIGWTIEGPGIVSAAPATAGQAAVPPTTIVDFAVLNGPIFATGVANEQTLTVTSGSTATLAVGNTLHGFGAAAGLSGTITAINGQVLSYDGFNPSSFPIPQPIQALGAVVTLSQPATATANGVTFTAGRDGSVARTFGWFDISGANFTRDANILSGNAFVTMTDITGISPGLLVAGSGIPAGAVVTGIQSPNFTVGADVAPAFGATSFVIHYGLLKT